MTQIQTQFHHKHCDYLSQIFKSVGTFDKTVRQICKALRQAEAEGRTFSHIAVSGVSGCVVGSAVALRLKKHLIVVRKEGDGSHSDRTVEGYPQEYFNYIVLDDFISSGETLMRIYEKINLYCRNKNCLAGVYQYHRGYKGWYNEYEFVVGIKEYPRYPA